jgi:hypothetical protein
MSDTGKTKARRHSKRAAQGRDRKKKLEKLGTTPKFPIHPEKAPQAKA